MSRADKARLVAFDVIHAVHKDDAYSNLILPSAIDRAGLVGRDAGFATELTYGTLRRQVSLDAVINACAARDDLDLNVRCPATRCLSVAIHASSKSCSGFSNCRCRS